MSFDNADTPTQFMVTSAPSIVEFEVGRLVMQYQKAGYLPYHATPLAYCLFCLREIRNVKLDNGEVLASYKVPLEECTLKVPYSNSNIPWKKVEDKWFLENITDFDILSELQDAILQLNQLTPDEKKALTLPFNVRAYLASQEGEDAQGQTATVSGEKTGESVSPAISPSTSPTGDDTEAQSSENHE